MISIKEGYAKMQTNNQQSKEKEEQKNKRPQLKVHTGVHSGGCPPCQYPKTCLCDLSGSNCWCGYAIIG
jgi:hypothetical protein